MHLLLSLESMCDDLRKSYTQSEKRWLNNLPVLTLIFDFASICIHRLSVDYQRCNIVYAHINDTIPYLLLRNFTVRKAAQNQNDSSSRVPVFPAIFELFTELSSSY